jgi:AhpD family alkylhydroperoxidase
MAWVELADPDEATGETATSLAAGAAAYGTVLEAWKAIALVDGAFPPYLAYLRAVVGEGALDVRIKDLTAIRVGLLNGCRYSVSHRVASARRNGVDEREILAVAAPTSEVFDEPTLAALAFTDELTLAPPSVSVAEAPQAVTARTLDRVTAVYDDRQRAELALCVSLWNALTRFHRVLALDLDMPEPPAELDPARR